MLRQTPQAFLLGGNAPARSRRQERHGAPTAPMAARNPSGLTQEFIRKQFTAALVEAGDTSKLQIEFCRVKDAQWLWGLKHGLVYRKIRDGTIRSLTLREPGKKFGVRLLYVESIRTWLMSKLEAQESGNK